MINKVSRSRSEALSALSNALRRTVQIPVHPGLAYLAKFADVTLQVFVRLALRLKRRTKPVSRFHLAIMFINTTVEVIGRNPAPISISRDPFSFRCKIGVHIVNDLIQHGARSEHLRFARSGRIRRLRNCAAQRHSGTDQQRPAQDNSSGSFHVLPPINKSSRCIAVGFASPYTSTRAGKRDRSHLQPKPQITVGSTN